MKTINAIKKIEKTTGSKVKKDSERYYSALVNDQVIEFIDQEGEVICISTRNKDDHSDSMTDYFPQIWHDNITQAINFVK